MFVGGLVVDGAGAGRGVRGLACGGEAAAAAAGEDAGSEAPEQEPTTPTSEGSRLQPLAECPPAPRKPAWAPPPPSSTLVKRKFPSSAAPSSRRAFFPVARDLTSVFRALPPKKRIRAG
ncbi:unnamed protein product [Miscanthus lutarioriparius]|uniref:Uncharacterized protein n=1 Tax=Miscanthus lutarioriparius TaxID=422564 RepID=A0A811R3Z2_9POAL|nr:unnamed protein product [Miscanthus lutarioriparius]